MVVTPKKALNTFTFLDKLFVGILLVIFGGIVLHAPLSVGLGTLFPSAALFIKSWKEILMVVAGLVMLVILYQKKRWGVLKSPLIIVASIYAALHLFLLPINPQGPTASVAGLIIDLRYVLYFVLVYVALSLYPSKRRVFIMTFLAGAFVVAAFALLQVFVLPHDVLKYIGYNTSTIVPYLTVDQNPEYVRINSTLRGPNPLGAYAGIVLAIVFAFWLRAKSKIPQGWSLALSVIVIGSFVALWVSYSRSAVFGIIAAIAVIIFATVGRKLSRRAWIIMLVVVFALAGGLIAARNTDFVSNVLLHQNASTGASVNSNDGHAASLKDGVDRLIRQPLGGGIGSTGSASLYGDQPLIVENQFLFVAHETGWIGLGVFIYLLLVILRGLWRRRGDWFALGVFASGIGLLVIGLLLPVWVDDTVSIIWWGLAAVALATKGETHGPSTDKPINKKTKRTA